MSGRPGVLVIVVTFNSSALLDDLAATLPQAMDGIGHWRLVVADSGSSDGSAAHAGRLWPEATHLDLQGNRGYATGVNAGLEQLERGEHALVLNADIRLRPGAVAHLQAALEEPGNGIAAPRLMSPDGELQHSLRHEPSLPRALAEALIGARSAARLGVGETLGLARSYAAPRYVDWATGAALLISEECMRTVGPWDESLFLYSEETDYLLRARDRGFRTTYVPAAEAVHIGGDSTTNPELWSRLMVNRVRVYRRRHPGLAAKFFWAALAAGELLRAPGEGRHRAALRALLEARVS